MYPAYSLLVFMLTANTFTALAAVPAIAPAPVLSQWASSSIRGEAEQFRFSALAQRVSPASTPAPATGSIHLTVLNQEGLEKISRKIVDNLVNQRFENVRDDFSENLRSALSAEKIQEVWESVILQFGEFEEITSTQNSTVGGYEQITHRCKFGRNSANIEVTFSTDTKVVGLYIKP